MTHFASEWGLAMSRCCITSVNSTVFSRSGRSRNSTSFSVFRWLLPSALSVPDSCNFSVLRSTCPRPSQSCLKLRDREERFLITQKTCPRTLDLSPGRLCSLPRLLWVAQVLPPTNHCTRDGALPTLMCLPDASSVQDGLENLPLRVFLAV